MALTFALSIALLAARQDTAITYTTVAVPLSKALEGISKVCGQKLVASPVVANDIVIVNFEKVSVEEAKKRLASAVTGTWQTDPDGTQYLTADEPARNAERRAELEAKTKQIAEDLKNLQASAKRPAKSDNTDQPDSKDLPFASYDSASKLIAQLAAGLRASDLAAIPNEGRVVYSTTPNQMQRPLIVSGLSGLISAFVSAHNEEVSAYEAANPTGQPLDEAAQKALEMFGGSYEAPKRIDKPVSKILLAAENQGMFGFGPSSIQLSLVVFDSAGNVVATSERPLMGMGKAISAMGVDPQTGRAKEPTASTTDPSLNLDFEPSSLTKELNGLMNVVGGFNGDRKVSPELMQTLLHPDDHDPLSFGFSEELLQIAKAKGLNVVCCPPDTAVQLMGMVGGNQVTKLSVALQSMQENADLAVTMADGWLTVRASRPVESRESRVDRVSLARFLQTASKETVPSLDSLAEYAIKNPPPFDSPAILPHLMLVCPNAMSAGIRGMQDWKMLRLYGQLGASARSELRSGRSLAFGSLSVGQSTIVRQMVYGAGATFDVGPVDPNKKKGLFGLYGTTLPGQVKDFRQEPTELLPSGLPALGGISLSIKKTNVVIPANAKGSMLAMMGALGSQELAMLWAFSEDPKMSQLSTMFPKLDKFQVGDREELTFTLNLAKDVRQDHFLTDSKIAKDAPVVSRDQLPKAFLDEVADTMKKVKEGILPLMNPGMGGPQVPPRS